jgi:molecular chaperone GrpE
MANRHERRDSASPQSRDERNQPVAAHSPHAGRATSSPIDSDDAPAREQIDFDETESSQESQGEGAASDSGDSGDNGDSNEADSNATALLATAQEEIAALRDQLLRLAADFDNYRKRATREQQEIRDYAIAKLLHDVLPVADNLDRALAHCEGDTSPVIKGVQLVQKQLADTLARHGVQGFQSVGVVFDPERHEAVAQRAVAGRDPGTIVEELQKGYTLRDRLLRPAQVVVATTPPVPDTTETAED